MASNKKYNFKEGAIKAPFYKSKFDEITNLIERSITFNLISIPGVGVTQFFRYFVMHSSPKFHFIFVDSFSLTTFTKISFFKQLLSELGVQSDSETEQDLYLTCQARLQYLAEHNERVVLIFTRFDKLSKEFDHDFFAHLRHLRNINPQKIVMIFTANKPLYDVNPAVITGQNLNFLIHNVYFGTYSEPDLRKLAPFYSPLVVIRPKQDLDRAVRLCNGHINLLNLILNSEAGDPTQDRFISIQIKDILDTLTYSQLNTLKKIAQGRKISDPDSHLVNLGLIKHTKSGDYEIFCTIITEYLKSHTHVRLPAKENKLFHLLKKKFGQVVSKEEIFEALWSDDSDSATDWALNALIYRLKKNPAFKSSGYLIENHKKIGYVLIKN